MLFPSIKDLFSRSVRRQRRRKTVIESAQMLEARALLTVAFQFEYQGAIGSGIGFEDATNGQARRDALEQSAARLGSIFSHTATITMGVTSSDDSSSSTLASAGTESGTTTFDGFDDNEVVRTKILTGNDLNGSAHDGTVDVNWGQPWELSSDAAEISDSEFDYYSTIYHELLHAVGFSSVPNESGQDLLDAAPNGQPGVWSYFDQFITDVSGTPIINASTFALDSTTYDANKTGGASPASGLFFNGPKARQANGGNPVGLYTPSVWEDGSSLAHLDDENPALQPLMMASATDTGPGAQNLSTLERAVLEDLGYTLVAGVANVTQSGGDTSVTEAGATDAFDVVLSTQPLVDVVLNVSSSNTDEAIIDTTTLTFTALNWNVAQTVTVTGVDDSRDDGDQTTSIVLSVNAAASDDAYDFATDATVSVTTIDDDTAGFTITQTDGATLVAETATIDTFDVVLTAQPATDVVITVASGDTGEATVDVAMLTFTNANWNVAQTVTVTGVDDALLDGDQTTTVTLSVDDANSDDAFDPAADQTVSVVTTDDEMGGFTVSETGGTTVVSEIGTTDTFDVVLTKQPATDVVIFVSGGDATEAFIDKSALTFTNANWNVPQTVTVTGVDEGITDGDVSYQYTLSIDAANSDDAFDGLSSQTVSAMTTDDESPGLVLIQSGGTTVVSESGTTDLFEIVLTVQPSSDVVLTVVSGDTGEATVDVATLTFTDSNWNVRQTVTITGIDDALLDGDQTTTVTISVDDANSADAYDSVGDQTVSVATVDDEVVGFSVTETDSTTSVSEAGSTDTFDVALTAPPASHVVLTVVSGDASEAVVDVATLTFTVANWNTAQTVTVTGVDDTVVDGDQTATITLAVDDANSDDAFDSLADQTVAANTTDDEVAGFTVTETDSSTSIAETASTDTFDVVLSAEPISDIVLTVVSGDSGEATVDVATLTFTAANWNTAQTVTVTGVDDSLIDGDQTTTITLSVDDTNSADAFDSLADQSISVVTTDDDTAGFTVTETDTTTSVTEAASTDTFDVVLSAEPASDVVLTVVSGDAGEALVDVATLTFTAANWNTAQAVTVTGVDDAVVDGDQTTTITLAVDDATSDDAFDSLADQTVSAVTTDDDVAGFSITETDGATSVTEAGTTDTFDVVLSEEPGSDVVLTVVSGDSGEATVDVSTLTFTAANWNTAQTVTVTGVDDSVVDGDQTTAITLSVDDANSDDAFDSLADQTVAAATADDDVAGFTITETGGNTSVSETGTTDTFSVVLTNQPGSDVVLNVVSGDTGEATVNVATLTFTLANWNTAQIVTVTGRNDIVPDGTQTTLITLSVNDAASDDQFDAVADQTVSVATIDNDTLAQPTVSAPSGSGISQRPTVEWQAVSGASSYEVWINKIGQPNTIAYRQSNISATSFTLPEDLPATSRYRVWVRAHAANASSAYSLPSDFTVGGVPGTPTLTAPTGASTDRPTFEWTVPTGATNYDLWVNQVGGTTRIIREQTLTGTSFTATTDLPNGEYKAWLRAYNPLGAGSWTSGLTFTVGAPPATPDAPTVGVITEAGGRRAQFDWPSVSGAVTYELWVNQIGGTTRIIHETTLTTTSFNSPTFLPIGSYRAWIRATDGTGIRSLWSEASNFTV